MTLLHPSEIFSGKLLASLRVAATVLFAAVLGSLPLITLLVFPANSRWKPLPEINIACVSIMLVECLAMAWIVTVFSSIVARRMASALVLSFVTATMMLGGNAIIINVLDDTFRWYRVGNWVGTFSPYFAYGLLVDSPTNQDSINGWYSSHVVVAGIIVIFLYLSARLFTSRHMQDR
jgi:ABC-type Na+ efflux pump permease subunit